MQDDLRSKLPFLQSFLAQPEAILDDATLDRFADRLIDSLIKALAKPFVPQTAQDLEDAAEFFAHDDVFVEAMRKAIEP